MSTTDSNPSLLIGIVGGLGPHAHIEFENLLLTSASRQLGRPATDQDYPQWVLSSMPNTPDRTLAVLGEGLPPVPLLRESLRRLAAAGAGYAVIPCNTAHAFIEKLRPTSPIPIVDMIDVTIERAMQITPPPARLGLLATTGTCRAGVYHERAERIPGLELVTLFDLPEGEQLQERLVMTPIYGALRDGRRVGGGLKAGVRDPQIETALREAVHRLAEAGASSVICGCTEIPLGLGREAVDGTRLLDPMEVLADRVIAIGRGEASWSDVDQ